MSIQTDFYPDSYREFLILAKYQNCRILRYSTIFRRRRACLPERQGS